MARLIASCQGSYRYFGDLYCLKRLLEGAASKGMYATYKAGFLSGIRTASRDKDPLCL